MKTDFSKEIGQIRYKLWMDYFEAYRVNDELTQEATPASLGNLLYVFAKEEADRAVTQQEKNRAICMRLMAVFINHSRDVVIDATQALERMEKQMKQDQKEVAS